MTRITALLTVLVLALAACGDDVAEEPADDVAEEPEGDAAEEPEGDAAEESADDAAEESADDEYSVDDQPDAAASFVSPADGDTVSSPVTVELAAEGVELAPAGEPAVGEAHQHVMVDIGCYDSGESIPGPSDADEAEGRFHLGDGSDSREIDLEPGTYELCVQLADGIHQAFGSTETLTVTVE
jgi:hypothetical protein